MFKLRLDEEDQSQIILHASLAFFLDNGEHGKIMPGRLFINITITIKFYHDIT